MLVFRRLNSFSNSFCIHSQTGDALSSCPMSGLAWAERGVAFHARPVDKQCDHCLFSRWVNVFFIHFFIHRVIARPDIHSRGVKCPG